MSLMPTAPNSIGGVLDNAIRLYRRALLPCFPIVVVAVVLTAVPSLLLTHTIQPLAKDDPQAVLAMMKSPVIWLLYIALIVIYPAVYGALIAQVDAIAHGNRLTVGAAFGVGVSRAPTMLGVFILVGLMVFFGIILLVIPGIWVGGLLQLAVLPPILERAGVGESLETSRRLIKGNWWRATTTVFVAGVIVVVLMLVVSIIGGVIAGIFAASSAAGAADVAGTTAAATSAVQLTQEILSAILNLFTMAFLPSVLIVVYYDLKLRKEGTDLAAQVGALNSAG